MATFDNYNSTFYLTKPFLRVGGWGVGSWGGGGWIDFKTCTRFRYLSQFLVLRNVWHSPYQLMIPSIAFISDIHKGNRSYLLNEHLNVLEHQSILAKFAGIH